MRITHLGFRAGDGADMAMIELVGSELKEKAPEKKEKKKKGEEKKEEAKKKEQAKKEGPAPS